MASELPQVELQIRADIWWVTIDGEMLVYRTIIEDAQAEFLSWWADYGIEIAQKALRS